MDSWREGQMSGRMDRARNLEVRVDGVDGRIDGWRKLEV